MSAIASPTSASSGTVSTRTAVSTVPPRGLFAAYHDLYQVERSFRMAKSDLKARPMFHHERDSIEANLTVVATPTITTSR